MFIKPLLLLIKWKLKLIKFKDNIKMPQKMKCPKCNHHWITKSELLFVTCPCCQRKVEIIITDERRFKK